MELFFFALVCLQLVAKPCLTEVVVSIAVEANITATIEQLISTSRLRDVSNKLINIEKCHFVYSIKACC